MVRPNGLKCKPGFYYEDFITLSKRKISSTQEEEHLGLEQGGQDKKQGLFSANCGISTVAGHLIIIPWGRQQCKTVKTKRHLSHVSALLIAAIKTRPSSA